MKLIEYITMHTALNIAMRQSRYLWLDLNSCNFWNPSPLETHQLREAPPSPQEHESLIILFQIRHSCVIAVPWHSCQSLSSAIITATSLSTCSLGAGILCHDLCARNATFTSLGRTECCPIISLRRLRFLISRPYDLRRPFTHLLTYSFVHLFLFTHIFTPYVTIINLFIFIQQIINVLSTMKYINEQK